MASSGPSTITGIGSPVRAWVPKSWSPLWNSGVSGGVEVFGSALVGIGEVGVASADEAEDLAVVDDREDQPVPEAVDQPTVPRRGGEAAGGHLRLVDAFGSEVLDEGGPSVRRVSGLEVAVAGQLDPEPVTEVGLRPGPGEPGFEVAQGDRVHGQEPVP